MDEKHIYHMYPLSQHIRVRKRLNLQKFEKNDFFTLLEKHLTPLEFDEL